MKTRKNRLEFDALFHIADECITGPFKTQESLRRSEPYAYTYIWNELYRLPFKGFLRPFLNRLGINEQFIIEKIELVPKLEVGKYVSEPDILVKTNENLILFEFKNYSRKGGSFQEHQLSREFISGLKESDGKPLYLILVNNEEGNKVFINKRGKKNPFDEIYNFADFYLKKEKVELKNLFKNNYKRDRIIIISWKKFLDEINKQIEESKKLMKEPDLVDIYERVQKRISTFSKQRLELYFN